MKPCLRILVVCALLALSTACATASSPTVTVVPTVPLPTSTQASVLMSANTMLVKRAAHTATLLRDGTVLIAGGMGDDERPLVSAELYDLRMDTFTSVGDLNMARVSHTATLLPDGRVLIAGGYGRANVVDSAELYDPQTRTFKLIAPMTTTCAAHTAVLLKDSSVLLAGGLGANWKFLETAELFDPATEAFTATGNMSLPRVSHTATLLYDGRVLIAGGQQGRRSNIVVYASAEIYDPLTGTFTTTGDVTIARHKHAASLLLDGRVLLLGGADESDWRGRYASSELYDPATGVFTASDSMKTARFKLADAVVSLKNGRVLVAGGAESVETFDPATGVFESANGQIDAARFFSTATLLSDGRVLILGGYDSEIVTSGRAWLFTP